MSKRYRTNNLYVYSMGSIPPMIVSDKSTETKEEELLWHINRMREHDGLRPYSLEWFLNSDLLRAITFEEIEE